MAKVKIFNPAALEQGREYPAHTGPALLAQFLEVLTGGDVATPEQAAALVERTLSYDMSTHTRFVEPYALRKSLPLPTANWQGPAAAELRVADEVLHELWSGNERNDSLRYQAAHEQLAANGWLTFNTTIDGVPQYHLTEQAREFTGTLYGVLSVVLAYVEAHRDNGFIPASERAIRTEAKTVCGILRKSAKLLQRGIGSVGSTLNAHRDDLPVWAAYDTEQINRRMAATFGLSATAVQG